MQKRHVRIVWGISVVWVAWLFIGIGQAQASSSDKKDFPEPSAPPLPGELSEHTSQVGSTSHPRRPSLLPRKLSHAATTVTNKLTGRASMDFRIENPADLFQPYSREDFPPKDRRVRLTIAPGGTINGKQVLDALALTYPDGTTELMILVGREKNGTYKNKWYQMRPTDVQSDGRVSGSFDVARHPTVASEAKRVREPTVPFTVTAHHPDGSTTTRLAAAVDPRGNVIGPNDPARGGPITPYYSPGYTFTNDPELHLFPGYLSLSRESDRRGHVGGWAFSMPQSDSDYVTDRQFRFETRETSIDKVLEAALSDVRSRAPHRTQLISELSKALNHVQRTEPAFASRMQAPTDGVPLARIAPPSDQTSRHRVPVAEVVQDPQDPHVPVQRASLGAANQVRRNSTQHRASGGGGGAKASGGW